MREPKGLSGSSRAAVRGVVAAMAMTGFRTVSAGLGLKEAPPEEIAARGVPSLFGRIPAEHRAQAIQLAHWAYGGFAGAGFAALPHGLRRLPGAGPAYGLAIWLVFEAGIAPLLGLRVAERDATERVVLAADHLLYGAVVGARPRRI